jgi:hypothetical protein
MAAASDLRPKSVVRSSIWMRFKAVILPMREPVLDHCGCMKSPLAITDYERQGVAAIFRGHHERR